MSEIKTYQGSCHCGKVSYEVTTDFSQVISCNCSICTKKGYMLTFVPKAKFQLLSGKSDLSDYQFGSKRIHHQFCSHCGVSPFGRGTSPQGEETFAVNLRCVEGVDLSKLTVTPFDGKSL